MAFNLTPEFTFLIGLVIFWAVIYLLAYVLHLDKRGLDVKPAYFMYKSKRLNSSIDRLVKKQPFMWTTLSNIGLAFGLGLMALSIYFLVSNLLRFTQIGEVLYVAPVVPGLTLSFYWLPFFMFAAVVVILPHELAHGIVARLADIPVLSTGVLAFVVFFGAFVEPDEKEFEKASLLNRLRMLAAGSSTNLVTALLVTLLMTGLFVPSSSGVLIQDVAPNGPAYNAGLQQWDVIQAINGRPLNDSADYYDYMSNVTPDTLVVVTVMHANRVENMPINTTVSSRNSSIGALGILPSFAAYRQDRLGLDQYTSINLFWALFWIYLVGISVAIFNMLPLYPFDGERVLYYPLERLVKKRKRELRIALSAFTLGLFALNVMLSLWRYGLLAI